MNISINIIFTTTTHKYKNAYKENNSIPLLFYLNKMRKITYFKMNNLL